MTFVNRFASLLATTIFFCSLSTLSAQEEIVDENSPPPDVDGLFDEPPGLTPIDDDQVERPRPGPRPAGDGAEMIPDDSDRMDNDISPAERPSRFSRPSRSFGGSSPSSSGAKSSFRYADRIPKRTEKLRMDFVQVDIEEVVKYFAEQLKIRFIYDPTILSGKITIVSPEPVTVDEAYQAFMSAMEIRGYVVYPNGPYFKIDKVTNARKSPVPLYLDSTPKDDSYVTRIITLKFLNVRDIRQAVRDLVSRSGGDVIEHAPTNTLIISDYAANIRRIIRILNILDVEGFQEQIAVVPLQYASAADVARKISEIFPTGASGSTATSSRRRTAGSANSAANQSVIQKVVADDRTNSLIILGSERGIAQVKQFIAQIDVSIDGGEGGIYVYPLQNVKAEELSQTLASLASGQRAGSTATRTPAPTRTGRAAPAPAAEAGGSGAASLFDGEVKITADATTNALVIQASRRDFEVLKGIISQLDIRRRQVFIESVILEAQVNGGSRYGTQASGPLFQTEALGRTKGTDRENDQSKSAGVFGFGNLGESPLGLLQGLLGSTAITGLALGFRSGGTVPVTIANPQTGESEVRNIPLLTAIIRLAAENTNLNVLSTPHILATANQAATISIGDEIPQLAQAQATEGGQPIQSFNRIKVATELTITPQINAGDYLTLEIDQKVNEVKPGSSNDAGQVATITREAKTTAIVQDGQTIVIGGIMRDKTTQGESKVPFLGDIPILGWLFKSRTKTTEKVNLLLFITPHIIRDTGDMNDIFFRKLKEREGFLDRVGMNEKKSVPIHGLSQEQLKFLDEDYVKSLQLYPLPSTVPGAPTPSVPEPVNTTPAPTTDENSFKPALPMDLPTIPVAPKPVESYEDELDIESPRTDSPSTPSVPEPISIPVPSSSEPEVIQAPAPIETAPMNSTPSVEPQSAPQNELENDLPPLEDLLEEDSNPNGTEGILDTDTRVL